VKVKVYFGGGSGTIQLDLGTTIPSLADVASSITSRSTVDTPIAQSDPVVVAAGQTVIVTANASVLNNSGGAIATPFSITTVSGPTAANGPTLSTPTVASLDSFPLAATAAFTGLAPGTYVFGLWIHQGRAPLPWNIGDWEVVTQIVG
jgi:hypothetical protein